MTFMQKIITGICVGLFIVLVGGGFQHGLTMLIGFGIYFGTIIWGLIKTA